MGSATHNTPTRHRGIRWAARAGIGTALLSAGILAATPWDAPRTAEAADSTADRTATVRSESRVAPASQSPDFRCWPCRARWTAAQILRSSPSRTTVSTSPGRLRRATSAGDEIDWEKLDRIIREHNRLHDQWNRQREYYTKLTEQLMTIGTRLQHLQSRAETVGRTMDKIRGVIGHNADNADVFAPPETPRWNQSLAKTYTLRAGEMGRLGAKASHAVNEFNATLGQA